MPAFTNMATLSYNGTSVNSNVVTGFVENSLTVTKSAAVSEYTTNDSLTYVVSIVNSSNTQFSDLTVTDNLGEYEFNDSTLVPMEYVENSLLYYSNGIAQEAPQIVSGDSLQINGITVPANGNVMLIYQVELNSYAPLGVDASMTNVVVVSGESLCAEIEATETITTEDEVSLAILKAMNPSVVSCDEEITYSFTIQNLGNTEATAEDNVVLRDIFDPILNLERVELNGNELSTNEYTYDIATGEFATNEGLITVPAAEFTQNADGSWTTTPGVSTLVISGRI